MEDINWEPKVAELLNSKVGKYLRERPFLALVLLVFGVTASVPIGLFLAFTAVTFISVAACFIFVEIFLLMIGGTTLLCVLFCLAMVAFWVSCVLSTLYIIISLTSNFSSIHRTPAQIFSTGDMETKEPE
ncbi:lipid droplet assembly factor 1-A-like isoform X2 [Hoplias malabaricus]|uniref:lipid droplet assembly factor 1-A-like isoform X2 n=1 Tax=Hoplias malabaricus TaxID=27720 RepID=UPI003461F425